MRCLSLNLKQGRLLIAVPLKQQRHPDFQLQFAERSWHPDSTGPIAVDPWGRESPGRKYQWCQPLLDGLYPAFWPARENRPISPALNEVLLRLPSESLLALTHCAYPFSNNTLLYTVLKRLFSKDRILLSKTCRYALRNQK